MSKVYFQKVDSNTSVKEIKDITIQLLDKLIE